MSTNMTHPSDELLATYLDGSLSRSERRRVAEHVAACEDCYEIVSGVVDFQIREGDGSAEREPASEPASGLRPDRPWFSFDFLLPRLVPVAAMLLAAFFGFWLYRAQFPSGPPPELAAADLLANLAIERLPAEALGSRGGNRGPGEDVEHFELGVLLVDLHLACRLNAREALLRTLDDMARALAPSRLDEDLVEHYRGAGASLAGGAACPSDLLPRLERWEEELTRRNRASFFLAYGKWTEAAYLAARAEDEGFFAAGSRGRKALDRLLGATGQELSPAIEPAAESLRRIEALLDRGPPGTAGFAELRDELADILCLYLCV